MKHLPGIDGVGFGMVHQMIELKGAGMVRFSQGRFFLGVSIHNTVYCYSDGTVVLVQPFEIHFKKHQ